MCPLKLWDIISHEFTTEHHVKIYHVQVLFLCLFHVSPEKFPSTVRGIRTGLHALLTIPRRKCINREPRVYACYPREFPWSLMRE